MQTASAMMAAKKQAKRNQEINRKAKQQIGNKSGDRNKTAAYKYQQAAFLCRLKDGEPCDQDINVTDEIRNLMHYGTLVYEYNIQSVMVFEKLIRAMRLVSAIYQDTSLRGMCRAAEEAINRLKDDDSSPNERRIMLRPLVILSRMAAQYGEIIPAKTTEYIAEYCAAIQVCLYATSLYDRPISHIKALDAVINGESLRSQAKKYGIKEPLMRDYILSAAWNLYRIAECFVEVEEPNSIPDLRRPEWLDFGNPENLQSKIGHIVQTRLIPFENATGLTLIDYNVFRRQLVKIETQSSKETQ
ncbi:TPA: hypothetical protein ACFP4Q_000792 [Neisseria weaveri]